MIQNKKAMSGVITILIIISLALVALGIVWYVIQGVMDTGKEQSEQGLEDMYNDCVIDAEGIITDEGGEDPYCNTTINEIRIVGGDYCCVPLPA